MSDFDPRNLLSDLLKRARTKGVDGVDILFAQEQSRSVRMRLRQIESVDQAETSQIGLRLLIGKRQSIVSTTDFSERALSEMLDRAVNMAKLAPEDPFCGLADPAQIAVNPPALDINDPAEPTTEELVAATRAMEEAALAVPGITTSDEASSDWGRVEVCLLQSNGFEGHYKRSQWGASTAVIAGEGTGMERDYDYTSAVYRADMKSPEAIGRGAGERAVKRLNPRKMPTARIPVVMEPRIASSILGHLASAINGAGIARGTSFLKDKLDQKIFPSGFAVIDDPHRARGPRSRPFDAEGIPTASRRFIDDGMLTSWILDLRSARQLKLQSTGHAGRGASGPPGPGASNLHIAPGKLSPTELISDIREGLYVTELIGMGVNGVTGDYSRGASGFWIENGRIAHAVNEMTIAGNLLDMFQRLTAANDLELRLAYESPTLRIEGMTVAGI
ncbi:MAG: TldD/PmbA family protein [Alphaproteobacteria bacterium]